MASFKVEVIADRSGKWCANGLRFTSEAGAQAYGADLALRWTMVEEMRVTPSEDPPNDPG